MTTPRPVGRPAKNGVRMTNAERQRQFRERQKQRDRERFLEIMAVIREEYCNEDKMKNHNEKDPR